MVQLRDIVRVETLTGEPVAIGNTRVTPQSQAFTLRLPAVGAEHPAGWAMVYHRPLAVLVERGGATERMPILDVTRRLWLALAGATLFFTLASLFLGGKGGPSVNKEL